MVSSLSGLRTWPSARMPLSVLCDSGTSDSTEEGTHAGRRVAGGLAELTSEPRGVDFGT